ncbi:MAG: beta-lactamase family protein [Verrucomicrobia bacterium]|nr:beta-lactamase family protein [Verrucomicrobiota bacterium]
MRTQRSWCAGARWMPAGAVLAALAGVCGCAHKPPAFNAAKLSEMDAAIHHAIAASNCPGGVLWLEHRGRIYTRPYGHRALEPQPEPMTPDTIFDLASLTKVVACTPAVMLLVERGQLRLDDPVARFIPEFTGGAKEQVTVRQLLNHTSGLRPDVSTRPAWEGYDTAIRLACAEQLRTAPGAAFRYSDINFFLLGDIVRRVSGMGLEQFVEREICRPLKMHDTGFLPPASKRARIAPTQRVGTNWLRGTVHDPTSRYMGGVAGHAGLFSTAPDLARYARMLLHSGTLDGRRIFQPATVQHMTGVQTPPHLDARRGFGWDIDSGYSRPRGRLFALGSYGHTGFTGTCLWIDPFSKTFWMFLSNRVHPDGKGNVLPLQSTLGTLAAQAVTDFDFTHVPGALVPRAARSGAASLLPSSPGTSRLRSGNPASGNPGVPPPKSSAMQARDRMTSGVRP